ncbi:MAG: glycosyltransferase, partial [Culicoidibacterales bacterium]
MAILQIMSYDSYPFESDKNFITHPQNGLERHLAGLHKMYWEKNYYLQINNYDQSLTVCRFTKAGELFENYRCSLEIKNDFTINKRDELSRILLLIVNICKVELVHFHFQQPITLLMIELLKEKTRCKLIHTMHDLSYACGSYYYNQEYQVSNETIQKLNLLDIIIFPDQTVENIYREKWDIKQKTYVIPHGTDIQKIQGIKKQENVLKVLFLGAMNVAKGGEIVAELVQKSIPGCEWHILGRIEVESLNTVQNYDYHGSYTSFDLQSKLEIIQPDVIVLPSQMIETFSYNL